MRKFHQINIYQGKDSQINPPECPPFLGISAKIVWDLIYPLLGKGYHLYLDNYYTGINLLKALMSRNTVACGTVRKNHKGLCKMLLGQRLKVGESRAVHSEHLLCVKYKDRRDVLMLSTIHDAQSSLVPAHGSRPTQVPKPVCLQDYNKYMGGVDLSDQVLQPYNAMRKTRVWYKKISVHLTQIAMYNSFVLYRYIGSKDTFLQFQEKVIKSLIFAEQELEASASTPSTSSVVRIVPGQHFPGEIPVTGKTKKPHKSRPLH